jgi:glycine/D-amino acid oxidase-like deaminating enzyme
LPKYLEAVFSKEAGVAKVRVALETVKS